MLFIGKAGSLWDTVMACEPGFSTFEGRLPRTTMWMACGSGGRLSVMAGNALWRVVPGPVLRDLKGV
jgi:hypothetical protein